jgi:two-component system sensor histidine kinase/response regulator
MTLKAPLYALRNLFRNVQLYDLPGDEIKILVPEVINELTYTTGLDGKSPAVGQKPDAGGIGAAPAAGYRRASPKRYYSCCGCRLKRKKIYISSKIEHPIFVYADKDMINLVLRNLLSNAIKFTPIEGSISV